MTDPMCRSLVLAAAVALAACDSQAPISPPPFRLDAQTDSLTRVDAGVLALRYTLAVERDTVEVDLDPALLDELYRAVGAVRASAFADTVRGIRTFPFIPANEIYVRADSGSTWIDGWADGDAATGYAPVDDLVETYGLRLLQYWPYRWGDSGVLISRRSLNTVALGRRFEAFPGVWYAGANGRGGDGNDIEAERQGDGWRLEFSRAWGDCPAGCIHRQFWTFRVEAGEVAYLGTRER